MVEHVFEVCSCGKDYCPICNWGAAICEVCGGAEGTLTFECPTAMTKEQGELVMDGALNYVAGRWIEYGKDFIISKLAMKMCHVTDRLTELESYVDTAMHYTNNEWLAKRRLLEKISEHSNSE